VASCITNPLEVIKTRLQASASSTATTIPARLGPLYIARQIMRADGISRLCTLQADEASRKLSVSSFLNRVFWFPLM
jgi:Mitochondrial carrier protein